MTDTLQQRLAALRAKRAAYPRFRRDLLWIRDIGSVVDAAPFFGSSVRSCTITDIFWRTAS